MNSLRGWQRWREGGPRRAWTELDYNDVATHKQDEQTSRVVSVFE
jgi:hypothetical protein